MRELGGMAYTDVAAALGTSVPAVKSLLVRARVSLVEALEARDSACAEIREELMVAHDLDRRPSGLARRHMHDCAGCREFRGQMRDVSRQLAALAPTLGPLCVLAKVLGIGGGAGAGGAAAAAAGTGAAAAGAAIGTGGAAAATRALARIGHVAELLAAAALTAGGVVPPTPMVTAVAVAVPIAQPAIPTTRHQATRASRNHSGSAASNSNNQRPSRTLPGG
jgi:hypothetical protein